MQNLFVKKIIQDLEESNLLMTHMGFYEASYNSDKMTYAQISVGAKDVKADKYISIVYTVTMIKRRAHITSRTITSVENY